MAPNRRYVVNAQIAHPERVSDLVQVSNEERRRRSERPSAYRRNIYRDGQWSARLPLACERPLEHSAEYFRRNPCELDRLIPWINRDLQILLNANEPHIAYVLSAVLEALQRSNLRSAELRDTLRPYFSIHTDHFIHELMNFARTGIDIAMYDNFVTYPNNLSLTTGYVNNVQSPLMSSSSNSTASDDSDIRVVDEIDNGRIDHDYPSIGVRSWDMPGPSTVSQAFQMPTVNSIMTMRTAARTTPDILTISSSSSSDDNECEFVGYVKPRHERTPEIIELLSSDGGNNDDCDNNINNLDDNLRITPRSPSPEPRPSTSQNFDDDNKRVTRTSKKRSKDSHALSSNESQIASNSDSDSNYGEPKKKKSRTGKKRLIKSSRHNKNSLQITKKSLPQNTKKRCRKFSSSNDDDNFEPNLRKRAKTKLRKMDQSSSSDEDVEYEMKKDRKLVFPIIIKAKKDLIKSDYTEDFESNSSTNSSSSSQISSGSRSSNQNSDEILKDDKRKIVRVRKPIPKESKDITNTKEKLEKNHSNCPPVSTVLKKDSNKKDEWYVDKKRTKKNISDSSDDTESPSSFKKYNFRKDLRKKNQWHNVTSNDEFDIPYNKSNNCTDNGCYNHANGDDNDNQTERSNSQNSMCSERNESNKYKSKNREKYNSESHHFGEPCTSNAVTALDTTSYSYDKFADGKKAYKKRHNSHKKYKPSKQKRSKTKRVKKCRLSSTSSSSSSTS